MIYHGQQYKFYKKITGAWKRQIKRSRLKIRARRWDFFGRVRSLNVKQFRANIWANARFKRNYARKLAVYPDFKKDLERGFGNGYRPNYLSENGFRNNINYSIMMYLRKKYRNFKRKQFPVDLNASKKFYRKFHRTMYYRHQRNLQLKRIQGFLGNPKKDHLRQIWRTGTIKGNTYSADLFTFRFISRLPHLLYFSNLTCSLEFATHLVTWGFVRVNNKVITSKNFLVPVLAQVQLCLPVYYKRICYFMLFPYHRIYCAPFLEINWKLFNVRFLRIPSYREVIMPEMPFDHMFLYEQLAPVIK